MPKVRLALFAFVILAVPLVQAAPASGGLDVTEGATFAQGGSMRANGMDMLWNQPGLPTLDFTAARIEIERFGVQTTVVAVGPGAKVDEQKINERATHSNAQLRFEGGAAENLIAMRATGASDVAFNGGGLKPAAAARLASPDGQICDHSRCLDAFGVYELSAVGSDATLSGDIVVLVRGATVTVEDTAGTASYESGTTGTTTAASQTHDDAWVRIKATGATVRFAAPAAVLWYAAAPELVVPALNVPGATGEINIGARSYRALNDVLEARGHIILEPAAVKPGSAGLGPSLAPGAPAYADAFRSDVRGDISSVSLRAVPLFVDQPAATGAALAGTALMILVAAYFWPLVKFHTTVAVLPLYTRLKRPQILDNDVRSAIYETIRTNPGISARAVHRSTEQSWGTVVYHLRQLERHHLVVSREMGRTRNYYENHGKYRGMEAQLACLRNERARVLARVILERPGATQEDIAAASEYPQPTASYYVRKLKAAGLVEETRDGRYARYTPSADLARYLALADEGGDAPADAHVSAAKA